MLEQKGESAAGGVILLVTSGSPHGLTPYDIQQLDQVVRKGVRVVPIVYPLSARNPKPLPGVEVLAQLSGKYRTASVTFTLNFYLMEI